MEEHTISPEIPEKQESTPELSPIKAKTSTNPVMVIITVMVIFALGIAGFFFIKQNKNDTKTETIVTPSPTLEITPTIDPTDENAIESINVGEADQSDFEVIEADLKTL